MFAEDVNESWESTAFQDAFIKDYFYNQTPPKEKFKACKEIKNFTQNINLTVNTAKDLEDESTKKKASHNIFSINSLKRQKKKRPSDHILEQNKKWTSDSQKEAQLQKKCQKDSLITYNKILKSEKKKEKFHSKYKNVSIQKNAKKLNISDCTSNKSEENGREMDCDDSTTQKNIPKNKVYQKLQAAKFRFLNEFLYTNTGKEALLYFKENIEEFEDYHMGYQLQVAKWPLNPVDIVIKQLHKMNKEAVFADLGCGEAKIAEAFPDRTIYSFDLIALKDCVTACDIANVPLPDKSVDVAIFCLSLMGTNWKDYLIESRRILKQGAILKIAEIESRISDVNKFIKNIEHYGFSLINKNLSCKMFVFLNFKKAKNNVKSSKVKDIILKPCLYKKR